MKQAREKRRDKQRTLTVVSGVRERVSQENRWGLAGWFKVLIAGMELIELCASTKVPQVGEFEDISHQMGTGNK